MPPASLVELAAKLRKCDKLKLKCKTHQSALPIPIAAAKEERTGKEKRRGETGKGRERKWRESRQFIDLFRQVIADDKLFGQVIDNLSGQVVEVDNQR